jgi:hypothetical protein
MVVLLLVNKKTARRSQFRWEKDSQRLRGLLNLLSWMDRLIDGPEKPTGPAADARVPQSKRLVTAKL